MTSSYILYGYTTNGHTGTIEYICNIYIQYTYFPIQYIYLLIYDALKK